MISYPFIILLLVAVFLLVLYLQYTKKKAILHQTRVDSIAHLKALVDEAFTDICSLYSYSHYITETERLMLAEKYDALDREVYPLLNSKELEESAEKEAFQRFHTAMTDTQAHKQANNEHFIKNQLSSCAHYFDTVLSYPLDEQQREAVISLEDNVLVISSAGSGKTMTTVGKVRYLIDGQDGAYVTYGHRKMTFMTVHQSKGLECDYIILLNCNGGTIGFPSQISDSPVLKYVLSEPDAYAFSEERRVFYVGITRAKKHTWVLYDMNNPSPFVKEFVKTLELEIKPGAGIPESELCPKCHCGRIKVIKKGRAVNGNPYATYACTNEKYGCDYRETKFVNLNSTHRTRRQKCGI